MTPDEVRALRRKLKLTARKLAEALDTDADTVFAWESGERFPTKRHCEAMRALEQADAAGPQTDRAAPRSGVDVLADPDLWAIVRKLAQHPDLFQSVRKLADQYEDPAAD